MLTKIVLLFTALILAFILIAIGTAMYHKVNHQCPVYGEASGYTQC